MRVLQAITRMIVGGAQINTLDLCRYVDRQQFETTLLTGPDLGPEGDLLSVAGVTDLPVVLIPKLGREIRPARDAAAYLDIRAHLRRHPYDLVHTHVSKAGLLVRHAARRRRIPAIIHTAHGWQWTLARSERMKRFIIACERWAARFTDRIIVVAEGDREKGLREGVGRPEQYVVIESAICLDDFDPTRVSGSVTRRELEIPAEARVAGTVGRFSHPKEPEMMLRAAGRILEAREDFHFIYVGDGPQREAVLSGLGSLRDHPRLHLVGLRHDVPRWVAAMDVFLLSSSSEGLPRVVVEAMALEKPVISTPAGSVPELVIEGRTGCLVPFGNDEALAEAALALLDDEPRAGRFGREARRGVVTRFDRESMVRRTEALYADVLAEKSVR